MDGHQRALSHGHVWLWSPGWLQSLVYFTYGEAVDKIAGLWSVAVFLQCVAFVNRGIAIHGRWFRKEVCKQSVWTHCRLYEACRCESESESERARGGVRCPSRRRDWPLSLHVLVVAIGAVTPLESRKRKARNTSVLLFLSAWSS
jgi:hypothetical protein